VRLLVLGASGATGRLFVSAALAHGHAVTALVRDPARLPLTHERLRVVTGSALDAAQLEPAMAEQDAVVSALGTRARGGRVEIYSASTHVALEAMARCGVRRIVVLSAAGVPGLESAAVPPFFRRVVIPLLARAEYADMARMEALLAQSDAEWTALRPLWLRNGPALGGVRLSVEPFAPTSWGIRREDLASAMLQLAEQGTFVREGVWVGY
jgi:putative NADH-flavin reductase